MDNKQRIEAYFESCGQGNAADIAAHFTEQAVVYDTNHKPLIGAKAIGDFWEKVHAQWQQAVWYVDSFIADGDNAAIEWTMTGRNQAGEFIVRGSEHYRLEDGFIAEIRQYWTFNRDEPNTALVGFPYADRVGYFS